MPIIIVSQTTYKKIKNHRLGNEWNESSVKFLPNGKVSIDVSQDTRDRLGKEPEDAILNAMREYERNGLASE